MGKNKAVFCKFLPENWAGVAALYKLEPPFKWFAYCVVSTIHHEYAHETVLFAASEDGHSVDMYVHHAVRNTTSHVKLVARIGYELSEDFDYGQEQS